MKINEVFSEDIKEKEIKKHVTNEYNSLYSYFQSLKEAVSDFDELPMDQLQPMFDDITNQFDEVDVDFDTVYKLINPDRELSAMALNINKNKMFRTIEQATTKLGNIQDLMQQIETIVNDYVQTTVDNLQEPEKEPIEPEDELETLPDGLQSILVDISNQFKEAKAGLDDIRNLKNVDEPLTTFQINLNKNRISIHISQIVNNINKIQSLMQQAGIIVNKHIQSTIVSEPEITSEPEEEPKPEITSEPEEEPKPEITSEPEEEPKPEITSEPEEEPTEPVLVRQPTIHDVRARELSARRDKLAKKAAKIFTGQWIRWVNNTLVELMAAKRARGDLHSTITDELHNQIRNITRVNPNHPDIKQDVRFIRNVSIAFAPGNLGNKTTELQNAFEQVFRKILDLNRGEPPTKFVDTVVHKILSGAPSYLKNADYIIKQGRQWYLVRKNITSGTKGRYKIISPNSVDFNTIPKFVLGDEQEFKIQNFNDNTFNFVK